MILRSVFSGVRENVQLPENVKSAFKLEMMKSLEWRLVRLSIQTIFNRSALLMI